MSSTHRDRPPADAPPRLGRARALGLGAASLGLVTLWFGYFRWRNPTVDISVANRTATESVQLRVSSKASGNPPGQTVSEVKQKVGAKTASSLSRDVGAVTLEDWARQHPDEALAWVMHAPGGPERAMVAEIICLQLVKIDPASAVDLVEQSGANGYVLDNVIQQWAEKDTAAAAHYVLGLPTSPDRDRLLGRLTLVEAKSDPAQEAKWVAEQIAPGEAQDEAAIAVIHQWALRDPQKALSWAQLFPDRLRERALTEWERGQSSANR